MAKHKKTDWQAKWNEPLDWPGPVPELEDILSKHQSWSPVIGSSALVMVDVDKLVFDRQIQQVKAYDEAAGKALAERTYDTTIPNLTALTEFYRQRKRPIIHVKWQFCRHPYPPLKPQGSEVVVTKVSRGAFASSCLDEVLEHVGVDELIIAGGDTALGIASTVLGAVDLGYRVFICEDACVSASQEVHEATLLSLGWQQAHICTTKDLTSK